MACKRNDCFEALLTGTNVIIPLLQGRLQQPY